MTRLIALNFHGIGQPSRPMEPGEERYWIGEDMFSDIIHRIASSKSRAQYVVTFDDGNVSDHTIALSVLREYGIDATFFLLTSRIGKAGSLDQTQVQDLLTSGMRIGSHGVDHIPWTRLDDKELLNQLETSKRDLEQICDQPVTLAGIPFGSYNAHVLRALRRSGYKACYTSDAGKMQSSAFIRPRTSIRNDMSSDEISAVLAGAIPAKRLVRRFASMTYRRFFPIV